MVEKREQIKKLSVRERINGSGLTRKFCFKGCDIPDRGVRCE